MAFYLRLIAQIYKQVRDFGLEQIVGLILAILILLAQLHYGLITGNSLHRNELAIFWPYIAVLGLYLVLQAVRAPVALDRERAAQIDVLTNENEKQKNPDSQIRFQFQSLYVGPRTGTPLIILRLKILNTGPSTTLHDVRLCSDTDAKLRLAPEQNGFAPNNIGFDSVRIEEGDVRERFLQFSGRNQTRHEWALEFSDAHNKNRRERIPSDICEYKSC